MGAGFTVGYQSKLNDLLRLVTFPLFHSTSSITCSKMLQFSQTPVMLPHPMQFASTVIGAEIQNLHQLEEGTSGLPGETGSGQ